MGSIFKTPDVPEPPPLPSEPDRDKVKAMAERLSGAGRQSTLLTSPLGVMGNLSSQKKTLLGG
jgi:hypothetical protein